MRVLRYLCMVAILMVAMSGSAFAIDVPALTGRVVDNAKVLTPSERDELEEALRKLEEQTSAQVVILTIKSLEGADRFAFAQKTAETWKLGQKGKDNGLLILLALKERKIQIQVGYGLEGIIPDAEAWRIYKKVMVPKLKKGSEQWADAFRAAVKDVSEIIVADHTGDKKFFAKRKRKEGDPRMFLFVVAFIAAAIFNAFHPLAGGAVGAIGFGIAAFVISSGSIVAVLIGAAIGFVVGLIAIHLVHIGISAGGGGFGGGGGGFGGAGAGGGF